MLTLELRTPEQVSVVTVAEASIDGRLTITVRKCALPWCEQVFVQKREAHVFCTTECKNTHYNKFVRQ